jgi:iron complex transport system substrate-binding protein
VRTPTRSLGLGLAALLLTSACAGAPTEEADAAPASAGFPVDVTSCGHTTTVERAPEAAITMNQGATEVALALGLEDRLAGTAYLDDAVSPQYAGAYDSVDVLSAEYPDHETVLAAEPDFVYGSYASAFEDAAAGTQRELDELGVGSYLSPFGCPDDGQKAPVSFDSVWAEVHDVATVFGVPERADAIEDEQQAVVEQIAEQRPGAGLDVFWFDSGDKTALAGAGEGGPQVILDAVGATNLFAGLEGGWADVSWEQVVKADPDVIVLADASWSSADDKMAFLRKDPVLSRLRAVREDRIVTLPYSESTPGVRLADGAKAVADQLRELNAS